MSDPDIVLERDSTRVVDELSVDDGVPSDIGLDKPSIRLRPAGPTGSTIDLGGSVSVSGGTDESRTVATFTPKSLRLERPEVGEIRLLRQRIGETKGLLEIEEGDVVQTKFDSFRNEDFQTGGIVSTYDTEGRESVEFRAVPEAEFERSSGVVKVYDSGATTGRLSGNGAVLELVDDGDETGELVLIGGKQKEVDDVFIHATGKSGSERVVDAANQPRIALEGRRARLELGREELGDNREAMAGRIKLNYDVGGEKSTFLELGTTDGSSLRFGELSLRRPGSTGTVPSGSLRGKENLAFHADASPDPVMVVDASGAVSVQSAIEEEALDKVAPSVSPDRREVSQGQAAEFELVVGDGETIEFTIQSGSYYILQAFLETGSDARVRVRFDTDAAGQDTPETVDVVGDTTVDILEESDLDDPLEPGTCDLTFVDPHGEENATVEVTR